jgi:hypothetical protein
MNRHRRQEEGRKREERNEISIPQTLKSVEHNYGVFLL